MMDIIEFLMPSTFERILALLIFVALTCVRIHRMRREEARKDRLLDVFLKHYSQDKAWPAGTSESLRVMLQKDPVGLIYVQKSRD